MKTSASKTGAALLALTVWILGLAWTTLPPALAADGAAKGGMAAHDGQGLRVSGNERQDQAAALFYEIFELSQQGDRNARLPEIISLYEKIINDYADTPLAQESYWRLMEVYLRDFAPPKKNEALGLYDRFRRDYPDSPLQTAVTGTITRFLFLHESWQDLLDLTAPEVEKGSGSGLTVTPLALYYYAEAKLHLGEKQAARQAFADLVAGFPDSPLTGKAGKRLEELGKQE